MTVLVVVLCMTPLALDYFIFGNSIPSNLLNREWASFLGGFIGAFFSIIGVVVTIQFTSSQNKKDRELQIRPYFDIGFRSKDIYSGLTKSIGIIPLQFSDGETKPEKNEFDITCSLQLLNAGLGSAIEIEYNYEIVNCDRSLGPVLLNPENHIFSSCIQANEAAYLFIYLQTNCISQEIKNHQKIQTQVDHNDVIAEIIKGNDIKNYGKIDIVITVFYKDILYNTFKQTITLQLDPSFSINDSKTLINYHYDICLVNISLPTKINNTNKQ